MASSTVLLVDDSVDSIEIWELFLGAAGFDVRTAYDGAAALASIEASCPDIVVMDLQLPIMTGTEVVRAVRANPATSHLPVIAMTGHTGDRLDEAKAAGFSATFIKPCPPDAVLAEIRRLLAG